MKKPKTVAKPIIREMYEAVDGSLHRTEQACLLRNKLCAHNFDVKYVIWTIKRAISLAHPSNFSITMEGGEKLPGKNLEELTSFLQRKIKWYFDFVILPKLEDVITMLEEYKDQSYLPKNYYKNEE